MWNARGISSKIPLTASAERREDALRLDRAQGFPVKRLLSVLLASVLTLPGAVECGWGASAPQAAHTVQGETPAQSNTGGQNPATSPQNPPSAAQSPEPATRNQEVQAVPRKAFVPPALTIPRLTRAPALENFLEMKPEGEIALQMA